MVRSHFRASAFESSSGTAVFLSSEIHVRIYHVSKKKRDGEGERKGKRKKKIEEEIRKAYSRGEIIQRSNSFRAFANKRGNEITRIKRQMKKKTRKKKNAMKTRAP